MLYMLHTLTCFYFFCFCLKCRIAKIVHLDGIFTLVRTHQIKRTRTKKEHSSKRTGKFYEKGTPSTVCVCVCTRVFVFISTEILNALKLFCSAFQSAAFVYREMCVLVKCLDKQRTWWKHICDWILCDIWNVAVLSACRFFVVPLPLPALVWWKWLGFQMSCLKWNAIRG